MTEQVVLALRCARALRRWALASGSALLAVGCAVPAPGAPSGSPGTTGATAVTATSAAAAVAALGAGFTLEGRISVNYGAQNLSGKVRWSHDAASDDIALASPLGTQVARLVRDSSGVALTDSEQVTHRAGDAESLTEQRLGWRLPLTGLSAWVRGRSLSGTADELRRDERGRIAFLAEDGWRVDYTYPEDGPLAALPRRLFMRYARSAEPLEVRLVIDQWAAP